MSKVRLEELKKEYESILAKCPEKVKSLETYVEKLEEEVAQHKLAKVFSDQCIKGLKEEVMDLKIGLKAERVENKRLEKDVEDLEQQIYSSDQTIQALKSENIDLMVDLSQERERTAAYKEDSKKTLKANQELRAMLKSKEEALYLTKKLLKAVL